MENGATALEVGNRSRRNREHSGDLEQFPLAVHHQLGCKVPRHQLGSVSDESEQRCIELRHDVRRLCAGQHPTPDPVLVRHQTVHAGRYQWRFQSVRNESSRSFT